MSTKKKLFFLLLGLSILTHFAFFGHPNQTVFDEVHFGKFISGYFTGQYFFDIHPPLGKLLLSGVGYITGFQPGFSFANIGETFSNQQYLWLRLLPALAGTLLPLVIFLLALELGFSTRASFLAGIFIIFENALNAQSRFILLDSFLLLFGFSALLFYLKFRHQIQGCPVNSVNRAALYLILTGSMAGLAASVKWTGLAFLGMILVFELVRLVKNLKVEPWSDKGSTLRFLIKDFFGLILIPLAIYTSIFALHFYLLPKSGPGDAFMSSAFQKTLAGNMHQNNPEIKPLRFVEKFKELNKQMYQSNQRITNKHPYGSQWYSWPFLKRTVFYWEKNLGATQEKVYLLGNPFIWWAGSIAIVYLILNSLKNLLHRKWPNFTESFLLIGFFISLLPFIGIKRVMFLYHYFPSLIFALLTLAYLTDKTNPVKLQAGHETRKGLFAFLLFISVAGFLYFSPFTYGLPLSPAVQNYLFWFSSWR
ncbi:hypothetical protein A2661_03090 [Candidatus Giovannonibacteria bacterium RIFCSPHIGHO2_01_FULL_45_24]|uniref:Polyprenol-phosphate-mannose--protein mannosyltransferase n=1 Tax=Candidatus Yanofskybacteria bacterium RIFCSPHIGHO2_02_FULL_43_15c TaxID=1802679 RepID=A0A1F8FFZ4_9BACT|nr:MAG: hypothetical protein A2661_03090 [Candidatus Giovannonibacteria bacterium RIFCSPHIGHO2_01_FULL_45_24]OGN12067.1 MAG: hypothetical protein A3C71_02390 [Candidatus Yanofskybacteria bacterium RIFCSPHIGHO2_02_FULL_43_15c]